ncbi:DUF2314 domain-containing protein [Alteromonas sp. AMM-1]|uniref:DUF2314 domain-containing protein n=1 Tax=Alteromonas sp. AMM-1 TaxID=3394233 RepID=UPI0039A44262
MLLILLFKSQGLKGKLNDMLRLLGIAVFSFTLFFPSYWVLHYFFGPDLGAPIAFGFSLVLYPYFIAKVWHYYPPIDVVAIDKDDVFNQQCIARARSELHRLESGLSEGKKDAFVKFAIKSNDGSDHVWGIAHSMVDASVIVTLVSEPVYTPNPIEHLDIREKIPVSDIQDWMLIDKQGNCEGGYTHLAMVNAYKKQHGKVPKKYLKHLRNFVDLQESESR